MAHINFVIPGNRAELLDESDESVYYVRNLIVPKDIAATLKTARAALRDEGAEFIIDAFDLYYSVVHHGDLLKADAVFRAYEDLHRGATELNKALGFLLEDKESINDELKMKYLTVTKMLLYMYTQIVMILDQKDENKNQGVVNRKKSKKDDDEQFTIDKKNILLVLNNIIQRDINIFWDPPVVEENFINIVSEVCYRFLQNPSIKNDKEVRVEVFNLIGTLIKGYSHGTTFVLRMVQLLKIHEHVAHCLPEGIQQLVESFNCKGIVHELNCEITEWQTDEKFQDSQGARHCGMVLTSLAVLMPDLMLPEATYLMKYLDSESPTLRNSVLAVIAEVILKVFSSHKLTEEQNDDLNEFLTILYDHMHDVSVHVRARVMQHWARLQEESVIPLKFQNEVLERVVAGLGDKGALVRKNAALCVKTFLTHNCYSATLSLSSMQKQLETKESVLRGYLENLREKRLGAIDMQWDSIKDELVRVIREELQQEKDKSRRESEANEQMAPEQLEEIVRMYIQEGKYKEAFKLCQKGDRGQYMQFKENIDPDPVAEYVVAFQLIFANVRKLEKELKSGCMLGTFGMTHDELKEIEPLQTSIDFLRDCVAFLKLIDSAIVPMSQLLETTVIGDMHAAVDFFICAYQFNIDNASLGILAMLRIMQRNEPERRDYIVNAFKTIYLQTDCGNISEHCSTIVNRLVEFVKSVPLVNVDDLHLIISEWTAKGILDNSVIDMLWQYFTRKVSVTEADSRAATELLTMCAAGRKTIITRNIKLVAMLAFGERGEGDMLFLGSACKLLAAAGRERIDIDSKNAPFKFKPYDDLFKDFLEILKRKFFEPVDFYNQALEGGIDFIYRLCSKPEWLSEDLISHVVNKLVEDPDQAEKVSVHRFLEVRLCHLLGLVAIKLLDYLDEALYRELKRRNNIRDERKAAKKMSGRKTTKRNAIRLTLPYANESLLNTSLAEESILEGAQAEDTDAEFILNVLENHIVTGSGTLAKLAYIVKDICERPDVYDDPILQGVATIAFIRYMLVSSKFCTQNIQLLFTIFERTQFSDLKCSILVHLSDLLTRFPNIVEPWMPRIYQRLKDSDVLVRKATFFTLSSLILRDMIRAHNHISEMACCLVENDTELSSMCKTFFVNLSHKENDLYNVLPDIFSHLMDTSTISEENGREIMKFLFQLMDKSKHMENLVDRFCCKYKLTEDIRQHRDITFCLTLIQYNEKGLKKLVENFPLYKHLMHDAEIYASFKGIMQSCGKSQVGKSDLKSLVSELEKSINSVFELNEDGNLMKPPPVPSKKTKSRSHSTRRKKLVRKSQDSDSDDDYEGSIRDPSKDTPEPPRASRCKKIRGE